MVLGEQPEDSEEQSDEFGSRSAVAKDASFPPCWDAHPATTACEESGTLGEDSGTLGKEAGTLGKESGTLCEESGSLGKEPGPVGKESGALRKDSGALGKDSGATSEQTQRPRMGLVVSKPLAVE